MPTDLPKPIRRSSHTPGPYVLGGATALLLAAVLVLPLVLAIGEGFLDEGHFSLTWLDRVVHNRVLMRQLLNGVLLAALATALSALIALPLAVLRGSRRFLGAGLLGALVLVPMILPPFVGALSMRRLLGQFGSINLLLANLGMLSDTDPRAWPDWLGGGFAAVAILQALHLFPILYLNASAALANVDPAGVQAARNLGASPWRAFWRVTAPLMRPGLFAGGTIVFIWSFTDVGTPLVVGYQDLAPVTLFNELAAADAGGRTYCLVFLLLAGSAGLFVIGKLLFGRSVAAQVSKASLAACSPRLGVLGTLGAWVLFGVVIVAASAPHAGVALMATSKTWVNSVLPTQWTAAHLQFVLTQEQTYRSILNSLQYAGVSTALDMLLGIVIAWLLVRSRIVGRGALDALAMLPLAVPGLILAAGYVALTAWGPLKAIGPRGNPFVILAIAYAVRRLPFTVRGVSAGLEQVSETLEEAARNLGASRAGAFCRVTIPLIAANAVAAGVLVFAYGMLEVSDSLVLAQTPAHYPIAKQIYILATSTGSPETANQAAALGLYGMALLGATLALAAAVMGKKLGAIFRG
ncbi:MAG: iron ABC transporter permease [Planctomycetota bacterium]|nr:iron ABC transporter permease [Planctomycetota bacterium]